MTKNKVNMTRIQSKPSKFHAGDSRHVEFYVDIEGTLRDQNVIKAVD